MLPYNDEAAHITGWDEVDPSDQKNKQVPQMDKNFEVAVVQPLQTLT
jgi:hypothetical protein